MTSPRGRARSEERIMSLSKPGGRLGSGTIVPRGYSKGPRNERCTRGAGLVAGLRWAVLPTSIASATVPSPRVVGARTTETAPRSWTRLRRPRNDGFACDPSARHSRGHQPLIAKDAVEGEPARPTFRSGEPLLPSRLLRDTCIRPSDLVGPSLRPHGLAGRLSRSERSIYSNYSTCRGQPSGVSDPAS